jgi:predicted unusual protein kinase regulating ubiquinone biosynthesis (AarF/ABC1/UbiB family)
MPAPPNFIKNNNQDPHPGNLLATRDGDLCFLDFGMMSSAPPGARYAIIAHVVHLVNRCARVCV